MRTLLITTALIGALAIPGVAAADSPPKVAHSHVAETCAEHIANGTGVKWLWQFGCVKRDPRKEICDHIRLHGGGPRWYVKFGCVRPHA